MIQKIMVCLCLLLSVPSFAHEVSTDAIVGAGIGKNVFGELPFERYGTIGLRYGDEWKIQLNGGYYLDPAIMESSFVCSLQGGIEVDGKSGVWTSFMFGPAYLFSPDDIKLSGHFQFHLTGGIGIKDSYDNRLGITWNHYSNAGFEQPNLGRDLLTLQLVIPLF
jgi:hypothetical protein